MMAVNHWLPMLGEVAAAAAVAAAALLARRADQRRVSHRFHDARVKSWENEGGSLAAATK
jgi:hypothetical protein